MGSALQLLGLAVVVVGGLLLGGAVLTAGELPVLKTPTRPDLLGATLLVAGLIMLTVTKRR
jgi:hypothetical protein